MDINNKKIETKMVRTNDEFRCIYVNESFGWKYIDIISENESTNLVIFKREILNTEEFKQIIANENEYYNLTFKRYYEEKKKLNIFLCILLFLLFIIPGIIYLVVHFVTTTKPKITEEEYKASVNEFWRKSNILLWESRRLSFNTKNLNLLDYSKTNDDDSYDDVIYYKEGLVVKDTNEDGRHYGGLWQIYGDEHYVGNNSVGHSTHMSRSTNKNNKQSKQKKKIPTSTIVLWFFLCFPVGIVLLVRNSFIKK